MKKVSKKTLHIQGMHCPSCDVLVKDTFTELPNIKSVKADHKNQTAEVCYTGKLDESALNGKLKPYGYLIVEQDEVIQEPFIKRISEAGTLAVILFIIYYFVQALELFPNLGVSGNLTLITVFILGLVASTSTCMATSGALFLATIGKLKNGLSFKENIVPALAFNVGRVASYGAFGFVVGLIGQGISSNLQLGVVLNLFIAVFMIIIALDMLKLISFSRITSLPVTKTIFENLQSRFIKKPKQTAFFLGAITYLLPCGFTQSVQLYALGTASPVMSAVIMMIFALGTVPALLALGFASSFTRYSFYPLLQKAMGVIILLIGLSYILNFASLRGFTAPFLSDNSVASAKTVKVEDGYQIMHMSVDNKGYFPASFTVKKGTPVKWIVDGKNVFGCQSILVAPKLGIQQTIQLGKNVIEFTPEEKGVINFSCSMGMYNGQIAVI